MKYLTASIFYILLVLGNISAQDLKDQPSKKYKAYLTVEGSLIAPPSDVGLGIGLLRSNINDISNRAIHQTYQYISVGIRFSYLAGIRAGFGKSGKEIGYRFSMAYERPFPPGFPELRFIPAATVNLSGKAILSIGPTLNIIHNTSRQLLGFEFGIQLVPGRWSD